MQTGTPSSLSDGWQRARTTPSLQESYRSIFVNHATRWRRFLAFAGPGYMVAVGYMDPGNWATDLAGGSRFGYSLLSVILISNLMAVLLQGLASKLGIVTGRDLAQACRDHYSSSVNFVLWVLCELAIAACDLAEVIGSAIGLKLLFGIPLTWGILLTALDVMMVLFFLDLRLKPWLRRLITRAIAIAPAVIVSIVAGESGTARLLVFSQVILSLQLSFAVVPLVQFTSDKAKMGEFVNSRALSALAWLVALVIGNLNAWLLVQTFKGWMG